MNWIKPTGGGDWIPALDFILWVTILLTMITEIHVWLIIDSQVLMISKCVLWILMVDIIWKYLDMRFVPAIETETLKTKELSHLFTMPKKMLNDNRILYIDNGIYILRGNRLINFLHQHNINTVYVNNIFAMRYIGERRVLSPVSNPHKATHIKYYDKRSVCTISDICAIKSPIALPIAVTTLMFTYLFLIQSPSHENWIPLISIIPLCLTGVFPNRYDSRGFDVFCLHVKPHTQKKWLGILHIVGVLIFVVMNIVYLFIKCKVLGFYSLINVVLFLMVKEWSRRNYKKWYDLDHLTVDVTNLMGLNFTCIILEAFLLVGILNSLIIIKHLSFCIVNDLI